MGNANESNNLGGSGLLRTPKRCPATNGLCGEGGCPLWEKSEDGGGNCSLALLPAVISTTTTAIQGLRTEVEKLRGTIRDLGATLYRRQ